MSLTHQSLLFVDLLDYEDIILHYAHSKLQILNVDEHGVLSSHLFKTLAELCSSLQYLILHPSDATAPPASLVRFLEKVANLETLNLGKQIDKVLLLGLLEATASCSKLEQLTLPYISDDCLPAFHARPRGTFFFRG